MTRTAEASQLTARPNKRRAGANAGGLEVAESRPQMVDGRLRIARCTVCRHPGPQTDVPWCPACFGAVDIDTVDPTGTVWAVTTVRIPVGRWKAPFGLAYVDVIDGPRVLVHVPCDPAPTVGQRLTFAGSADGDLVVADASLVDGDKGDRT